MTPTAPELLAGCSAALSAQPQAEDAGVYMAARLRTVAVIQALVAQECATGTAARVWENAALRSLLIEAAAQHGPVFGEARTIGDGDMSLAALDDANAKLRRLLIRLHEAVETAADYQLDRSILALYREMARRRELKLPAAKPVT
jgi:hypothetical protein